MSRSSTTTMSRRNPSAGSMSPGQSQLTGSTLTLGGSENSGFKINLTSHNIARKNFEWNTTLNFSRNSNRILNCTTASRPGSPTESGKKAITQTLGTLCVGLVSILRTECRCGTTRMGIDKDIFHSDRVADKSATPIGFGGLINSLTYGNWSAFVPDQLCRSEDIHFRRMPQGSSRMATTSPPATRLSRSITTVGRLLARLPVPDRVAEDNQFGKVLNNGPSTARRTST